MRARSEKLERLEERQRLLLAEIEREKAVLVEQERKRDARRKIIVGAMVLGLVERGEWPREQLLEKLDAYLSRDHDRELFDLAPRHGAAPEAAKGEGRVKPAKAAQG